MPGMVVYLDGKPIGHTSGQIDRIAVTPGRHVVQLRGEELESVPIPVVVRQGAQFHLAVPRTDLRRVERAVKRVPRLGVIEVTSSPTMACEVVLLGMIYQKTEAELTLTGVPVGTHAVELRQGEVVLQAEVPVEIARTTRLEADFTRREVEVVEPAQKPVRLTVSPIDGGPPLERRDPDSPAPLRVGGAVRPPVKISGTSEIGSPDGSRKARVAIVDLIVDERGQVETLRVVRAGSRHVGSMARSLVRTWRFEPATRHGAPVAVHWRVRFTWWGR